MPLCFKQSGAENRCGWPFGCKKTSLGSSGEVGRCPRSWTPYRPYRFSLDLGVTAAVESMTSLWVKYLGTQPAITNSS